MDNNKIFTIMPMAKSIDLNPGDTYEGTVTILNPADATEDFTYHASVVPYGVSNDGETVDIVTDANSTQISKWITIKEPTGTLKPNESVDLKYTIKVPDNAPGGGQFAAITVSSNPEAEAGNEVSVQNIFEMASVIYATVAGDIVHDGQITENSVPGFVLTTPVTVKSSFTNHGNVHETATITITASDLFTGQVILPTDENDGVYAETVMPDASRYAEREVSNLPSLGIVKITQDIQYSGQTSTVEKVVIICPIWFLALVVLVITALILTIVHFVRKHQRNKDNY